MVSGFKKFGRAITHTAEIATSSRGVFAQAGNIVFTPVKAASFALTSVFTGIGQTAGGIGQVLGNPVVLIAVGAGVFVILPRILKK